MKITTNASGLGMLNDLGITPSKIETTYHSYLSEVSIECDDVHMDAIQAHPMSDKMAMQIKEAPTAIIIEKPIEDIGIKEL
jgi:hypothetical protein